MILKLYAGSTFKYFCTHISYIGYRKKISDNSFHIYYTNEYFFDIDFLRIYDFDFVCYDKETGAVFNYNSYHFNTK